MTKSAKINRNEQLRNITTATVTASVTFRRDTTYPELLVPILRRSAETDCGPVSKQETIGASFRDHVAAKDFADRYFNGFVDGLKERPAVYRNLCVCGKRTVKFTFVKP